MSSNPSRLHGLNALISRFCSLRAAASSCAAACASPALMYAMSVEMWGVSGESIPFSYIDLRSQNLAKVKTIMTTTTVPTLTSTTTVSPARASKRPSYSVFAVLSTSVMFVDDEVVLGPSSLSLKTTVALQKSV